MVVVNVDDRSSDISYSGDWYLGGTVEEYAGTTHGVSVAGATATFRFTGTSVDVYGSISNIEFSQGAVSTYSIDGGQQWTYAAKPGSDNQYRVPFYKSPQLSQGEHTLVIKTTRPSTHFWLDYIQYTYDDTTSAVPSVVLPPAASTSSPDQQAIPSTTSPSPSQTSTPTPNTTSGSNQSSSTTHTSLSGQTVNSTQSTQASGNNPTAIYSISVSTQAGSLPTSSGSGPATATNSDSDSKADTTSSSGSSVSRGTIAGVVVGVLALLAVIAILLWLILRKRKASHHPSTDSPQINPSSVESFNTPSLSEVHHQGGEFRKQAEADRHLALPSTDPQVGRNQSSPLSAQGAVRPPDTRVTTLASPPLTQHQPPLGNEGQQYIVVYQSVPAEAPPSYQLRQSAGVFPVSN